MLDRRFVATIAIVVTAIGVGAVGVVLNVSQTNPLQVPPPLSPPGDSVDTIVSHGLEACAEAVYWQDFMPMIPEEGPPFFTVVRVNVTNTGNATVSDLRAIRMTIYFDDSMVPLVTLNLTLVGDLPEIGPGENVVLEFTNSREQIYSPTIDEGTRLYSRVLVTWGDGIEMTLTTPPSPVLYTY